MGMFKQMKDAQSLLADAPGMIDQANQAAANAQAMAAAYQAQAAQAPVAGTPVAGTPTGPDFEPIANVSLALYAEISKGLAAVNYDQAQAPALAAAKGVSGSDWEAAVAGWNARMQANPAVGTQFNALYSAA